MTYLKLAWRNLWRNKRRSLIILTSVIIGMIAVIFFESLSLGIFNQMLNNQIGAHSSHIQVHLKGFNDEKLIQKFIPDKTEIIKQIENNSKCKTYSERIVSFGLITTAENSTGVTIVGVDPLKERMITNISKQVIYGEYLGTNSNEILLSKRMADLLNVDLSDKVVLLSSKIDGEIGTELFKVVGIYQTASSSFDKLYVYIPLTDAQRMLGMNNKINEIAILINDLNLADTVKAELIKQIGSEYEVLTFKELIPMLTLQLEMSSSWMLIVYLIIGTAMIFGIINAQMMAVFERVNEIGVLKAIGMSEKKLFVLLLSESIFLGLIGAMIGAVIGYGMVLYLSYSGLNFAVFSEGLSSWGISAVIYPLISYTGILRSIFVIVLVSIVGSAYPAIKAFRFQPIQAIRYV